MAESITPHSRMKNQMNKISGSSRLAAAFFCGLLLVLALVSSRDKFASYGSQGFTTVLDETNDLPVDSSDSQQLWEDDSSPNHNPYYNVFKNGGPPRRIWTPLEVRERVWQTSKDVEAMENHIEQQNIINSKMKKEVAELDEGLTREKQIVELIINNGMDDVDHRLDLLHAAISANVTAVQQTLKEISAQAKAKQESQDKAIAALNDRHGVLAADTHKELSEVVKEIRKSRSAMAAARSRLAKDREQVKGLIINKIEDDVGDLSQELNRRFAEERRRIRATIAAGLREVAGNVTLYSVSAGARIAGLAGDVRRLKALQKTATAKTKKELDAVQADHAQLLSKTAAAAKALRAKADADARRLDAAEATLEAEQALRKKYVATIAAAEAAAAVPAIAKAARAPRLHELPPLKAAAAAAAALRVRRGLEELALRPRPAAAAAPATARH